MWLPWAHGQTITVPEASPCWENATAKGIEIWKNCGLGTDYIATATLGFDWVLGGNLAMAVVGVLMLAVYMRYHVAVYPMLIGIMFLPVAWFLFPDSFITFGLILTSVGIGIAIWVIFVKQTRSGAL